MDLLLPLMPVAVVLAGLIAGAVLWGLAMLTRRRQTASAPSVAPTSEAFHVRDGRIVDREAAHRGRDGAPAPGLETWQNLRAWLAPRFGELPDILPDLAPGERRRYPARDVSDTACVVIDATRGGHRIRLNDPQIPSPVERHDALFRLAYKKVFREAVETAPCAICALGPDDRILWRNKAFRAFSEADMSALVAAIRDPGQASGRPLALTDPATGRSRHIKPTLKTAGANRILYATDVTDLVQADSLRSSFIQTLTKTFADLTIGLAVFDREQRLVLFNPAMLDLTGLPAEFLSARPGLLEFFDRLRDHQVLPEPKNYATWRAQINDMIESAVDGHYSEAWTLANGLTYRVKGRPHPDGAIAFLIEDVSDEISLSRRSRTHLEIRQAVLDRVEEAIAVTGPNGLVVFCNRACCEFLGLDPDTSFAETSFDDLVASGRQRHPDEAFWSAVARHGGRARTEAVLRQGAQNPMQARFAPLPGGYAMLSLKPVAQPDPVSA